MNRSRSRGFFTFDILTGLIIVGALVIALAVVLGRHRRAVDSFAESRQATELAESTLIDLQMHGGSAPADSRVEILPLDGGQTAPGKRWVQVRATVSGKTTTLIGLIPATQEAR